MKLYHLIVSLNNKGAVLLQTNLQASLFFFQTALDISFSGQLESDKGGNTNVPDLPQQSDLWEHLQIDETRHFTNVSIVQQNAFVRPIVMNMSLTAYSRDPFVNLAVAAVILTFNKALVFHKLGLEECQEATRVRMSRENHPDIMQDVENESIDSSNTEDMTDDEATAEAQDSADFAATSLQQARLLYLQALSSLRDLGMSPARSSGHSVIDLLIMAIRNNLGQIEFLFCEYHASLCHFVKLSMYASTINGSGSSGQLTDNQFNSQPAQSAHDAETAFILNWHISFFRHNFSLFPFPLPFLLQNINYFNYLTNADGTNHENFTLSSSDEVEATNPCVDSQSNTVVKL